MSSLSQPVLNGVVLPRPATHTRVPVPVETRTGLADGSEASFHQGHRMVFELGWASLRDVDAATVERLGMLVGPVEYVDLDGTVYVVTVSDVNPRQARAGTDPARYDVGLSLQEHSPRVVPPPPPTTTPGTGAPGGGFSLDPDDPNVVLITGTPDPNDPTILLLGG